MATRLRKAGGAFAIAGVLAISLVGGWEGLRTKAYRDIVDVITVCYGETRGVEMGDEYTVEECQVMLGDALVEFEQGMRRCLTNPDAIPEKSYVAFLSLSYNIGTGAFCGSTAARRLNAGDIAGACEALKWWNRAGGKVVQGLVNRRADEYRICMEGVRS